MDADLDTHATALYERTDNHRLADTSEGREQSRDERRCDGR
ncbi:MAG TPA: hypothetical protein VGN47_01790 [Blastococcus sp.]|nr:hypothetical protein [Blastococcus sp.]